MTGFTILQSFQENGRVIMRACVHWNEKVPSPANIGPNVNASCKPLATLYSRTSVA